MMNPEPQLGLDARYFIAEPLFKRSMEEVFYKNWLLACHSSQVRTPVSSMIISSNRSSWSNRLELGRPGVFSYLMQPW